MAIDTAGNAYVTGRTTSADFPTQSAYRSVNNKGGAPSAFVTKFSADGSSLVYSTYLGGSSWDYAYAIAVDSSGSAYVTGLTQSADFPITKGAYQTVCSPQPSNTVTSANNSQSACYGSTPSVFVTKLSPAGNSLVPSTFLGGYGGAYGTAIAVDSVGRAYVAGSENSPCNTSYLFQACFPTTSGATIVPMLTTSVTGVLLCRGARPRRRQLALRHTVRRLERPEVQRHHNLGRDVGHCDNGGFQRLFLSDRRDQAGRLPDNNWRVRPLPPLSITPGAT